MRGQGLVEYALIAVLIAIVIIVMAAMIFPLTNPQAAMDAKLNKYETVLSQCLERETISHEECEAIARQEAFGSSNNTTVVIPQNGQ